MCPHTRNHFVSVLRTLRICIASELAHSVPAARLRARGLRTKQGSEWQGGVHEPTLRGSPDPAGAYSSALRLHDAKGHKAATVASVAQHAGRVRKRGL